jgi:uncharacterized heparinase superfamily protein
VARLALSSALTRARRTVLVGRRRLWPFGVRAATRITLSPQDLRTADPTAAEEIIAGYFAFSGQMLRAGRQSPFAMTPPSAAWRDSLNGFAWLRHLRVSELPDAPARARELVTLFLAGKHDREPAAREHGVLMRRIQAFLANAPLLLNGADRDFYELLLQLISRDVAQLDTLNRTERGGTRLLGLICLTQASLCLGGFEKRELRLRAPLARELDRQVLGDGGHVSRNPRLLIDLLADLLPLRSTYATRGLDVPRALISAIDRMLPMLRMLRHADGDVVLMNGMGFTPHDLLSTLFAYDDALGRAHDHAPYSGYLRMAAGRSLLIADVGPPPPAEHSREATGGTLAFELSAGAHRIVINCGMPRDATGRLQRLARSSAAHSTVTVDDTSPAVFRRIGGQLLVVHSASYVDLDRHDSDEAISATARHDGYRAAFGLEHARRWQMSRDGDVIAGEDRLTLTEGRSRAQVAAIRFHLDPSIRTSSFQDGTAVLLALPDGEAWTFDANGQFVAIEDSMFMAAIDGMRRCEQLVIHMPVAAEGTVALWRFARVGSAARRRQQAAAPEAAPSTGEDGI